MEPLYYQKLLKKNNLRVTEPRLLILKLMKENKNHLSAEGVIKYFKENNQPISRASIYNTLDTFFEKGLIIKVDTDEEHQRYDGNTDFHIHLYDKSTNQVVDLFDKELEKMIFEKLNLEDRYNFIKNNSTFVISGEFKSNLKN